MAARQVATGAATGATAGIFGGPVGIAIGAGIGALGSLFAAKQQNKGIKQAAKTQAESANYGADRELEASREAEKIRRQELQAQWADAEGARRANYDQWVARQRSLNAFRKKYGFDETGIPDYVASQDPRFVQPEPDPANPTGFYRTFDRAAYQQYQQEHPDAPLSPEEWRAQFGGGLPDQAASGAAPPRDYKAPAPDSWRTPPRPRRAPMGDVGSFADAPSGGAGYQPYTSPSAAMSVGDYLTRSRRRR